VHVVLYSVTVMFVS